MGLTHFGAYLGLNDAYTMCHMGVVKLVVTGIRWRYAMFKVSLETSQFDVDFFYGSFFATTYPS
jgi:hypothetical protein